MERVEKEKLALERVEKDKLAKLEQRLAFAPSDTSTAAYEEDAFSDDAPTGHGAAGGDANKKKRKNFTDEEDAKLLEAFGVWGPQWDVILAKTGLDRTARQCQDRLKRLKKGAKEEAVSPIAPSFSAIPLAPSPAAAATAIAAPSPPAPGPTVVAAPAASVSGKGATRQPTITERFNTMQSGGGGTAALGAASPVSGVVADLKKKLEEQRQRTMEALEALKSVHERAEAAEAETDVTKRLYKKELESQLRARAKLEFEEARKDLALNSLRYGTIKWERHGNQVQEIWHQGTVYEELRAKEATLLEDERTVQALKTDLKARKKAKNSAPPMSKIEMDEQDEIYNIQLTQIKKRLDELRVAFESLQSDLALHKKELKRVRDEDESRFKTHPLLSNRYLLLKLVGKGGFSEVFKAYDVTTLKYVAVKLHQMEDHWPDKKKESYMKHALRELAIQKSVRHVRVVGVIDSFVISPNAWAAVMDYCEGRDLDFYLKLHSFFPEKEAKSIITQVVRALQYLHSREKPVIHFDLKPANILYHNSEVKLTDFGLSKVMEGSGEPGQVESQMELTSQGAGTYWYLPPECFVQGDSARISPKVDIWSVGVVFYQILYGKRPFGDNMSQQSILTKNLINPNSAVEFPAKPSVSEACRDFIQQCLTPDVRLRPTADQLLAHVYLQKPTIPKSRFKEPAPKDV